MPVAKLLNLTIKYEYLKQNWINYQSKGKWYYELVTDFPPLSWATQWKIKSVSRALGVWCITKNWNTQWNRSLAFSSI